MSPASQKKLDMQSLPESVDDRACSSWDNDDCEGTPYCPPRCPRFRDDTGTPMLVYPYEEINRDGLRAMYEEFDAENRTKGLPPATVSQLETWLDQLTTSGWNLVTVCNDQVVGHVSVAPVEAREPELVIFVHPEFQNRGIGTEMLKQVIAYADHHDHDGLSLIVASDNARAITVYENIGFDVVLQGIGIEMNFVLSKPIVDDVQLPPAERE